MTNQPYPPPGGSNEQLGYQYPGEPAPPTLNTWTQDKFPSPAKPNTLGKVALAIIISGIIQNLIYITLEKSIHTLLSGGSTHTMAEKQGNSVEMYVECMLYAPVILLGVVLTIIAIVQKRGRSFGIAALLLSPLSSLPLTGFVLGIFLG